MPRGPQGQKRPGDVIESAVMVAKIATGEVEDKLEDNDSTKRRSEIREEFKQDLLAVAHMIKEKFGFDNEDYLDFLTDLMYYFDHHKKDFPHLKKEFGTIFAQKYFIKRIH